MEYRYGIVAYFDILGFKSLIYNNEKILEEVLILLSFLRKKSDAPNVLPMQSVIDGSTFSDSFVRVVLKGDAPDLQQLAMSELIHLENIQRQIIHKFGLFVRGAITIGQIFIENNIIVGPALVRAVELEERYTNRMPVILLDHNIDILIKLKEKKDVPKTLEEASRFTQNGNPISILNYSNIFSLGLGIGNRDEGKKRALDFLAEQRCVILNAIEQFTDKPDILSKYKWLACYHNREIHKAEQLKNFQPEYKELCKQLVTEHDVPDVDNFEFYFQTWN